MAISSNWPTWRDLSSESCMAGSGGGEGKEKERSGLQRIRHSEYSSKSARTVQALPRLSDGWPRRC